MQKIIDNKLYDTDTAELLLTVRRFSVTRLYLSKNGTPFVTTTFGGISTIRGWEVKDLVLDHGSVELYTRLFGAPEEA